MNLPITQKAKTFQNNKSEYPVIEKDDLEPGVVAEANNDGTIFVDADVSDKKKEEAVEHEKVHMNQMERGDLQYDDDNVYWKGKTYSRDEMKEGDKKLPWEQAPQITEVDAAVKEIFLNITEKEKLLDLLHMLRKGTPIDEITQVILYRGVTQGVFNTDLMMLLIEPVMYLIIAIAEEYEIDPVIYEGMDQDIAEEEDFNTAIAEKNKEEKTFKKPTAKNVPSSILARVKSLPSEEELGVGE